MMKKNLDLTPDQVAQMEPILAESREKMKALREDTTLGDSERKKKRREIGKASMEQIRALLTPEQREKQTAAMKKRREEHKGKRRDRDQELT